MSKGLLDSYELFLDICHVRYYEKKWVTKFFTGKCHFLQKCVFSTTSMCYRSDLTTSTVFVRIPFRHLHIVPWGVSHSITREEIGQNLFFTGKVAFFSSKICVFNNLLGPIELILFLPQQMPEHLVALINSFLRFFYTRYYEKKESINFFHWKDCLFFKNVCFQQPFGVTEMIL